MSQLPPLTEAEKAIPYSKYYVAAKLLSPEEESHIHVQMKPEFAIHFEHFLDGFSTDPRPEADNRFYMFPDGTGFADMMVELKYCTVEMITWWFRWMNYPPKGIPEECGNLRYKIWDPMNHWDTRFCVEEMAGRVTESFDDGLGDPRWVSKMHPQTPEMIGLRPEQIEALKTQGAAFSCTVNSTAGMADRISVSVHQPKPEGGVITRARYWFGCTIRDGKPERDMRLNQYSLETVRKILRHNIIEKRRMDEFLPSLYAEYGHKPMECDD